MSNAFFRIRQKLIEEKKYRNYFVFALGEMLLIVIGILLALQIDNWNQSRQDNKIIEAYFIKISTNIESDISKLRILMEERKQALDYTDTILGYYSKKQISDPKLFERGFFSIFVETKFNPNKSAYESLKNSGFMSNVKNPNIEENLSSYYYLMERVSFVEEKFISIIQPIETILSESGFYVEFKEMFLEELINNYSELSEKGYEAIDLLKKAD